MGQGSFFGPGLALEGVIGGMGQAHVSLLRVFRKGREKVRRRNGEKKNREEENGDEGKKNGSRELKEIHT